MLSNILVRILCQFLHVASKFLNHYVDDFFVMMCRTLMLTIGPNISNQSDLKIVTNLDRIQPDRFQGDIT